MPVALDEPLSVMRVRLLQLRQNLRVDQIEQALLLRASILRERHA
jgi:hypothetical protein